MTKHARDGDQTAEAVRLAVEGWPASAVELVATTALIPYARNARTHSDEQVSQIMASIREWGFTTPILRDETGLVIAGHGRLMAAQRLGLERVPVVTAVGWSEAKKRAYVIADNKLALNAGWNEDLLASEIADLAAHGFKTDLLGFNDDELHDLLGDLDRSDAPDDGDEGSGGSILAALDVSIAEPRHQVQPGDAWRLGERHILLCVCVMTDWPVWQPYLTDGAVFCPYPGPFVPLSKKADETLFLLVQPDAYMAGHILDRYADVHGEDSVRRAGG